MSLVPRQVVSFALVQTICLLSLLLLSHIPVRGEGGVLNGVFARDEITDERRAELSEKLRRITGFRHLDFDHHGSLRLENTYSVGGSHAARELISNILKGNELIILEDASNRRDVVFARVMHAQGTLKQMDLQAHVVAIDFSDFDHLMGDSRALSAFDLGWVLLHEFDHILNDSWDPDSFGEPGACESHINLMRQESGLPARAEYFSTLLPQSNDSPFTPRFARLSFTERDPKTRKTKQYWVMWDASLVGGLNASKQLAARRAGNQQLTCW